MITMKSFPRFLVVVCAVLVWAGWLAAQTTISTGSIQGTVQDPQGAVVKDAKITITNRATGRTLNTETNSAGTYVSSALVPGAYTVHIEAQGFRTAELQVPVQVGVTANGNVRLQVGQASQVVEVQATEIHVNTEQATVQGVLTGQQIDELPINGRNFLDLAQLEPGVQIQDGGNFDPTKNGFSSISFGGRFGRTARIEVDGIDISDETVGTTTQNIPKEAIQEFQIGQSMLDLSTELTSSGAVNVVTRSGTNQIHGDAFGTFRDASLAAHLPGETKSSFQRSQYGGRFGGPLVKDRVFYFLSGERTQQALQAPVLPGVPFDSLAGNFTSPFRDTEVMGRLDYELGKNGHLFYRFSYEQNRNVANYTPNVFQPFANNNHTPVHALGYDFTTGVYNHSIRFGYTKFRNLVTDAVTGTSIFNPAPQLELAIGGDPFCLTPGADDFCSGPNFLAPQATFQSDKQFKYDGSRTWRNHIIRYGGGYNRLQGGGYAKFLGTAPAVSSSNSPEAQNFADNSCGLGTPCFPNGSQNPLNYPAQQVILGNGQGFSSELPSFGFPAGGLGPDNRLSWYAGDTYKFKPNFTITVGVRYVRDTGRTDSDLAPIPCSQLTAAAQAYLTDPQINNPCGVNILDLWGAGYGNRVKQRNANFAPQIGIVWDPSKNGKTVIRAGWGVFYENSVWNNNLYDRPPRLAKGLFLGQQSLCTNGTGDPTICNQPIGSVASLIAAAQQQYQASTAATGASANDGFIGNTLSSVYANGTAMFAPNYISPRSIQFNVGLQQEIRPGMVFTIDYLRNIETHTLLLVDVNHVGDAGSFDKLAAQAAIQATMQDCGFPVNGSVDDLIAQGCLDAGTGKRHPATIVDFAQHGLDSADVFCGGAPCGLVNGVDGPRAAFPGRNKFLGANQMLFPVGRSKYTGWQMSLKQNAKNPFRGVKAMNLQVSYALSRYEATAQDSDFVSYAESANNPTLYQGPNGLDRRHQLSFGGTVELPWLTRVSVLSHFYSPLPQSLRLPTSGNAGGIFVTDVNGDGTGDGSAVSNGGLGDLLPGTKLGAFGRTASASGLNALITNYNNTQAGTVTPAGQTLITNGLLTQTQLFSLGGVQQPLQQAPSGQVGLAWMKALDVTAGWEFKVREKVRIEPSVSIFNAFNFANFDSPNNPLSGILDGSPGSVNGTTAATRATGNTRIGLGTGVFGLGAPRVMEFGLRISF
jgi:hypothetical protein